LKPRLDLRVGHLQLGCDGGPLGGGEVLLPAEVVLELRQLRPRERRASLLASDQQRWTTNWCAVEVTSTGAKSSCVTQHSQQAAVIESVWSV